METIELKVKSDLYGTTTCVINIADFISGRRTFPCGDGCDHTLNTIQTGKINRAIHGSKPSYIRKTKDVYQIELDYGQGWEYETQEDTKALAKKIVADYNNNCTYPVRMIRRRVKINETVNKGN